MNKDEPRTLTQNDTLHLWFTQVSKMLNDAGISLQLILKQQMEIPVTQKNFKDCVWRPAQRAYLDKESTTELSKIQDIDKMVDILRVHFAEKFKVELPAFPNAKEKDPNMVS